MPIARRDLLTGGLLTVTAAGIEKVPLAPGQVVGTDPVTGELIGVPPRFPVDSDVLSFPTRTLASMTDMGGVASFLRTAGYATPGDGGEALYRRVLTEPTHAGMFRSADGAWWELALATASARVFGCLGVTDDSLRLKAALEWSAAHGVLTLRGGETIRQDTPITVTSPRVRFVCDGGSMLDQRGGGTLTLAPGISPLPNLDADIVAGSSTTATFGAPHGLQEGDTFLIWNPTDYSFCSWRPVYRDGRMFSVADVLGATQVRFTGGSRRTFAAADVRCFKLNGSGGAHIEGLTIRPAAAGIPLQLDGFNTVRLRDLIVESGSGGTCIDVFRSYGLDIESIAASSPDGVDQYTLMIANCQKGVVKDHIDNLSGRHVMAHGGRDGHGTVPTADIINLGFIAENIASNGIGAIDIHGGCDNVSFANGVTDGVQLSGRGSSLRSTKVYGRPTADYPDGTAIVMAELSEGVHTVDDVSIETFGNASTNGVIRCDVSKISGPLTLIFNSITLSNPNVMERGIQIHVGDSNWPDFPVRIIVDGFHLTSGTLDRFISITGNNDVTGWITGEVRNVTGRVLAWLGASKIENYGVPIRFPGVSHGVKTRGDVNATLNGRSDVRTQIWDTTLTADRSADFNLVSMTDGAEFEIVRTGGGAFALSVLGVVLAQHQSCRVVYRGEHGGLGAMFMTSKGPRV